MRQNMCNQKLWINFSGIFFTYLENTTFLCTTWIVWRGVGRVNNEWDGKGSGRERGSLGVSKNKMRVVQGAKRAVQIVDPINCRSAGSETELLRETWRWLQSQTHRRCFQWKIPERFSLTFHLWRKCSTRFLLPLSLLHCFTLIVTTIFTFDEWF